jgi:hypothetical protein
VHCHEWDKAGHQVTVITGAPNFPRSKVFEGYWSRLWQQEIFSGIQVIRVRTYITTNEGFRKRTFERFFIVKQMQSYFAPARFAHHW